MTNYLLPVLSVIIGGLSVFLWNPKKLSSIKLLLAFSGAFLLSITVLEILPNVYQSKEFMIEYWVLGGIILQLSLEYISKGAEHGHFNVNQKNGIPWAIWISLCFHSLLEGIPINYHDHMAIGVFFHKLPVAMLLSLFLIKSQKPIIQLIVLFFIFGAATPVGTYLSDHYPIFSKRYVELSALVSGMFLHISTTIIYESAEGHSFNNVKTFAIIIGVLLAIITIL